MRIVVVGTEGSGTNFVGNVIAEHPGVGQPMTEWDLRSPFGTGVTHVSLPHGLGSRPAWAPLALFAGCLVVIVRRCLLDATYSAYRRFYRDGAARFALRHQLRALAHVERIAGLAEPTRVTTIRYEALSAETFRRLFAFLSLDPEVPVSRAFANQNGKYLDDPVFRAAVVRPALGPASAGPFLAGRRPLRSFRANPLVSRP